MSFVPADMDTGRALVSRIDRLLARLEREEKNLDAFAAERVKLAIDCLYYRTYAIARDSLVYAEQAADAPWGAEGPISRTLTTKLLRRRFELTRREIGT